MNARRFSTVLCALGLAVPGIAHATTWHFTQIGWEESPHETGAIVTGSFTGNDANDDGVLELAEVSDYLMRFQGFKYGDHFEIGGLRSFRYIIGSEGFPPSSPHFADSGFWAYDAVAGEVLLNGSSAGLGLSLWISTHEPARVTQVVPLPASAGLALAALGAFIALGARGRRVT